MCLKNKESHFARQKPGRSKDKPKNTQNSVLLH